MTTLISIIVIAYILDYISGITLIITWLSSSIILIIFNKYVYNYNINKIDNYYYWEFLKPVFNYRGNIF